MEFCEVCRNSLDIMTKWDICVVSADERRRNRIGQEARHLCNSEGQRKVEQGTSLKLLTCVCV